MEARTHYDLTAWQESMTLVEMAYAATRAFPADELFGLTSQIRRSAVSIPSNIAEGSERGSSKDFAHFLNIAKGSCGELRTQLYIARKLELITKPTFDATVKESKELSGMLEGLRRSLLSRISSKSKRST